VAGQAIKAEGAEPHGQELSPTPVLSSTSTAEIEVDDGIETGNPHACRDFLDMMMIMIMITITMTCFQSGD
jgi:hypothetical protein